MQRLLFWLGLFFLANWWWRKQVRARMRARAEPPRGPMPGGAQRQEARQLAEPMARCAECGVHIPVSEALSVGSQHFCCAEHAHAAVERA